MLSYLIQRQKKFLKSFSVHELLLGAPTAITLIVETRAVCDAANVWWRPRSLHCRRTNGSGYWKDFQLKMLLVQ